MKNTDNWDRLVVLTGESTHVHEAVAPKIEVIDPQNFKEVKSGEVTLNEGTIFWKFKGNVALLRHEEHDTQVFSREEVPHMIVSIPQQEFNPLTGWGRVFD